MIERKHVVLLVAVALALCGAATNQWACKNSLGYPELPDGFTELGGSLVSDMAGNEYAFSHVCKGKKFEMRLQKLSHRDDEGRAFWTDIDVLTLPRLKSDEILVYGSSTCRRNEVPDSTIMAIFKNTEGPEFTEILIAWHADLALGKILSIGLAPV